MDDHRIADERVRENIQDALPTQPKQTVVPNIQPQQTVALSESQLQQHPDLLERALMAALLQGNGENTFLLLPHYQKLPKNLQDPTFHLWAKALIARWRHQYTQSVRLYRQALAQQPDWSVLRLQTAAALLSNKEFDAAEAQFRKVQSEISYPPDLPKKLKRFCCISIDKVVGNSAVIQRISTTKILTTLLKILIWAEVGEVIRLSQVKG